MGFSCLLCTIDHWSHQEKPISEQFTLATAVFWMSLDLRFFIQKMVTAYLCTTIFENKYVCTDLSYPCNCSIWINTRYQNTLRHRSLLTSNHFSSIFETLQCRPDLACFLLDVTVLCSLLVLVLWKGLETDLYRIFSVWPDRIHVCYISLRFRVILP